MKHILCFGDSNTWGYDPVATATAPRAIRHAPDIRWTGILKRELGRDYTILEEGQNGRTTVHDDPVEGVRNGGNYLIPCLETHQPLDFVVLMLGTNDLKTRFSLPPGDIAAGVGVLVQMILQSKFGIAGAAPKVLLIAPPAVGDLSHLPDLAEKFAHATEKSWRFPKLYRQVASQFGCAFLNSQELVSASPIDGLHLEAIEHEKLGRAIAEAVMKIV
jgi:lysophospholipase L1-like esterase